MTDTIRDLLISLGGHMAYMQGQLEARHELDDFEDFYWYRESVLLRQKVMDALTDEPAAGEPASVTGQPSDEAWDALVERAWDKYQTVGYQGERFMYDRDFGNALEFVRQGLARWGNPAPQPPAEGEVAKLVEWLKETAASLQAGNIQTPRLTRAALADEPAAGEPASVIGEPIDKRPTVMEIIELSSEIEVAGLGQVDFARAVLARWGNRQGSLDSSAPQPVPVSVSERLPGPEDCLEEGWAWFFSPLVGWRQAILPISAKYTHWLPAHALPLPGQEVDG